MTAQPARTVCPYDCPDTCGLLATVDGGRVVAVAGDPEHPVTRGVLCRKMAHYERSINHPQRLLRPLRRTGPKGAGQFAPIGWDEAIAHIASQWKAIIAAHGPEAILPYSYSGTMGVVGRHSGLSFFNYMGASGLVRTICSAAKGAGWKAIMGDTPDIDPREIADSDCIILWGSDVAATRLHLLPVLKEARRRGARVTLIETHAGPAAAHADETLLIRPGADAALALAMVAALTRDGRIDRAFLARHTTGWDTLEPTLDAYTPEMAAAATGIPADAILGLARRYGEAAAPALVVGSGLSRHRNGAMACRCIALLPAAVGAWGKPGGGAVGFGPAHPPVDAAAVTRPDFLRRPVRQINMNQIASALADPTLSPPIRSLYVYASNPAAVTGNQKALLRELAREDLFTVVHERFLTDTARFADIVLPATFSVEQADVHTSYGYRTLQRSHAVVPPPGECRSNWNTFRDLAAAMGYDDPHFRLTEEELVDRAAPAALRQSHLMELPQYAYDRFTTPDGKIAILNPALAEPLPRFIPPDDDGYPLRLVTAPALHTLNSIFNEREDLETARGPMTLLMNTEDARARGIADGDPIVCSNELAEVRYTARVQDAVAPGAVIAHGVHRPAACPGGLATNALLRERLTDLGEASTLNDNGVEVRPL